ncbi:MAG: tyrosine-type recombinase/integrase [Planctomycetota bacterium]
MGDKRAAEAVASQIRRKLKAGELDLDAAARKSRIPEFSTYCHRYLDTFAKTACKWSTWKSYETIVKLHLTPAWHGKRLDQITRADVKQLLLQKQQAGLAAGTVENIKALISGIFTHAYEDQILTVNPALKLGKYIQKQDHRRHINPLTREQATRFLQAVQDHSPGYYPLFLCAFRTGLRLGELVGLAWTDIDFAANTIEVRRSYSHGHWSTPKSHKSRLVDVSDQLKRVLLQHQRALGQRFYGVLPKCQVATARGRMDEVGLVFPSETGGPLCADNFRSRVFYPLIEKADLPRFRFHDIRHTYASLLLAQGESLHYVKEQMGHASIQTTVDVYGHLVPGSNRNAVNRLDDPEGPALRLIHPAGA